MAKDWKEEIINASDEELERRRSSMSGDPYEFARDVLLNRQLKKLGKPQWTLIPNFWMTVLVAIAAVVAAVAFVIGLWPKIQSWFH